MLIKLKKTSDVTRKDERDRHAAVFGSTRSLVVMAIEHYPGYTVFWVDHAGIFLAVRGYLVDIVDGTLSRWWRASMRGDRLFIGPPEIASADFEVDPTERPEASYDAYSTARRRIFEEAATIDPEAYDVRRFSK